ncbi:MAG: 2OG-Fe(II) oxygenase [Parcubacteria group bacterium GW2011_GWB1_56_8]|nr:MAG: 2OG-Fe(II) oxygenase [Parcubacteria group bacterium GW2011_GWB1_56_8]
MRVYVLPGLLSPEECEAAISYFPPRQIGGVVNPRNVQSVRRSRVAFLTADTNEKKALVKKLTDVIDHANQTYFKFDLIGHERLQLAEYGEGDGYDSHLDIGPGSTALRKLSASVQLSKSDDYAGGDLAIWNTPAVDRVQGTIAIFPSFMVHRITPVIRGLRRSLVAWATGSLPFR